MINDYPSRYVLFRIVQILRKSSTNCTLDSQISKFQDQSAVTMRKMKIGICFHSKGLDMFRKLAVQFKPYCWILSVLWLLMQFLILISVTNWKDKKSLLSNKMRSIQLLATRIKRGVKCSQVKSFLHRWTSAQTIICIVDDSEEHLRSSQLLTTSAL